jgi:hypothetical protein
MIGVIYATNEFLLSPLATERAALSEEIVNAEPHKREMRGQIARTRDLATKGPGAAKLIAQANAMIPDGSPIAWFPPKIVDFFKNNGIDKVTARMGGESPDKDLPGYRKLGWSIDIPSADFANFATTLSKLENQEPLFEFTGFDIQAARERVGYQHVVLTVQNIIKTL